MDPSVFKLDFFKLHKWYLYVIAILLGLLIGTVLTTSIIRAKDADKRTKLLQTVQTAEQALDWRVVEQQSFSQIDIDTPEWERFISKLDGVCKVTPGCKWVYLTYQDGQGNIREIVSTLNEVTRQDYTPPNTIYYDASPEYHFHFKTHEALVQGPIQDQWGTWVSAMVMHDVANVDGQYVSIGLDLVAEDWGLELYKASILPVFTTLAYLALIGYLITKNMHQLHHNTQLKSEAESLYQKASHDNLTGLANRALFEDRLKMISQSAQRTPNAHAVLFMDLDGFKSINDSFGHEIGDEVLKAVAARISDIVRVEDTLSRFGGDEFVLLISNLPVKQHVNILAQKIVDVMQAPIVIRNKAYQLGISIGFATAPDDTQDADELIKMADEAMFYAKKMGKNQARSYQELIALTA